MREKTQHELRCSCPSEPLLAKYGVDERGELYVHVKTYKQRHLYAEVIVNAPARVRLHCRVCLKWHEVLMRAPKTVSLSAAKTPQFLAS